MLITQAEQASIAKASGRDPIKPMPSSESAKQHKLLEGLRYLLAVELKLNQPKNSDGWLTQEALWLSNNTVPNKLYQHLRSQGIDGVPAQESAVIDVLQTHGITLPAADGKATWKATITTEEGWSQNLTLLKLSPAMFWDAGALPAAFTGTVTVDPEDPIATTITPTALSQATTAPESNQSATRAAPSDPPRLVDAALPDYQDSLVDLFTRPPAQIDNSESDPAIKSIPSPAEPSAPSKRAKLGGEHFMEWLVESLHSHDIVMNEGQALVHCIENTLFLVTPGIFQRYAKTFPHISYLAEKAKQPDWEWIQRRFTTMKLHRIQQNGYSIWTCEVSSTRRARFLHGYLLKEHYGLISDSTLENPHLKVVTPCNE